MGTSVVMRDLWWFWLGAAVLNTAHVVVLGALARAQRDLINEQRRLLDLDPLPFHA